MDRFKAPESGSICPFVQMALVKIDCHPFSGGLSKNLIEDHSRSLSEFDAYSEGLKSVVILCDPAWTNHVDLHKLQR